MTPPKKHVSSGTYFVGHRQPLILQAFLGTCVGVALYDNDAGVGGLLHLLLPEQVFKNPVFPPEKYASTGLPAFLASLYHAGANPHRLKAVVAGGALVGPVDGLDLSLDIGGRTVELAKNILTAEGIVIADSETGGFFTCCLQLDMNGGRWAIEPVGLDVPPLQEKVEIPAAEDILRATEAIQPIPQVALKLLRMADDDDFNIEAAASEVRKDQVISARTLRLCNSVIFGRGKPIDSIHKALIRLGRDNFFKFIVAAAVDGFYNQSNRGYSLCKGGLYHHALGSAVVAEAIAQATGCTAAARAYMAALLHDIGKVVLDQFISSAYPLFYRAAHQNGETMRQAEKRIFGIDHTEVGEILGRRWALPRTLTDAICYHHTPENPAVQHPDLVHITYLASLLMSRLRCDLELERAQTDSLAGRMGHIGLAVNQLAEIVDLIPMAVFHDTAGFYGPAGDGSNPASSVGQSRGLAPS